MKNILIAVSGLTPQVITETLYCLAVKKKIRIDEIYIITTERGEDIIKGKDKEYNKKRGYPPLISQIEKLCEKYKLQMPQFLNTSKHIITADEQSVEMYDIRNDEHNRLFPNKVCEVIKNHSASDNNVLHCSISGGRKTMSVDMALALSIFGRNDDKLYHVLTDEKLEFSKFFPENPTEAKYLEIAEIPYIRLRSLLAKSTQNKLFSKMSYLDLVQHLQNELKILNSDVLTLNMRRGEIFFGDNDIVKIPPLLAKLYRYVVQNSSPEKGISMEILEKSAFNDNINRNMLDFNSYFSKIKYIIRRAVNDENYYQLFTIRHLGKEESEDNKKAFGIYGIEAPRNKINIIDN